MLLYLGKGSVRASGHKPRVSVEMKGMASNTWSTDTLDRGVRAVAGQPSQLHSQVKLEQDGELAEALQAT